MLKRIFLMGLLFSTTSALAYSPNDPVAYNITQSIPSTVTTNGGTYVENITFKSQLPFTMVHPLEIAKNASPAGEFTYTDNCSGLYLTPGQTCTVEANLTPVTDGTKTLQFVIEGYSNAQVPVPQPAITTTASGNSGSTNVTGAFTSWSPASPVTAGTTTDFTFTFTNNGSTAPTSVTTTCSANATSCYSNCVTSLTSQGSTCTVTGSLATTNAMVGTPQVVTATLKYFGQGTPLIVSSSAITVNAGGLSGTVTPASSTIPTGVLYNVTYTFTNNTGAPMNITSATPPTPVAGWIFGTNRCYGATLGASGTSSFCTITGTYEAASAGAVTLTSNVQGTVGTTPYNSGNISTTLTATSTPGRIFNVTNNCPFPVWVSLTSGAYTTASAVNGLTCTATSNNCPTGTTCNVGSGFCYWNIYQPTTGTSSLTANGGTASIFIPHTAAVDDEGFSDPSKVIFWSGGLAGMTGCSGTSCITATCDQGVAGCSPGVGFKAPVTQAEFTLQPNTIDTYDVETINGFNIPLAMQPASPPASSDYTCGTAGDSNTQQSGTFSACNWATSSSYFPSTGPNGGTIDPSNFYWVTAGGSACTTTTTPYSCPSGSNTICGISQQGSTLSRVCGKFLGYMTADQACGTNAAEGQALGFKCNNSISTGTATNLYLCTGAFATSSYNTAACNTSTGNCCGCVNWYTYLQSLGISIPSSTAQYCNANTHNIDTTWVSYATPFINWMKSACPTVYTYPFDDKTSTFTCSTPATPSVSTQNTQNYNIYLCGVTGGDPGSNSGIPTAYATPTSGGISVYDGRNG